MLIQAIIVTVCAVGLYIYGMHLMKKIDQFLAAKNEPQHFIYEEQDCALVFGNSRAVKQICSVLKEHHIRPVCVREVGFKREEGCIRYMIAVSALDVDNLTMCRLAEKFYDLRGVYSICNEEMNRNMYRNAGVNVLTKEEMIQKICDFSEEKEQARYERII